MPNLRVENLYNVVIGILVHMIYTDKSNGRNIISGWKSGEKHNGVTL